MTFHRGETEKTFEITATDDDIDDDDESIDTHLWHPATQGQRGQSLNSDSKSDR